MKLKKSIRMILNGLKMNTYHKLYIYEITETYQKKHEMNTYQMNEP